MKNIYFLCFLLILIVGVFSCKNPEKDFEEAKNSRSVDIYKIFIDNHPDHELAKNAKDSIIYLTAEKDFFEAKSNRSIDLLNEFINRNDTFLVFPFLEEAKKEKFRLEQEDSIYNSRNFVDNIDELIESLQSYVNIYPDGKFHKETVNEIKEINNFQHILISAEFNDDLVKPSSNFEAKLRSTDKIIVPTNAYTYLHSRLSYVENKKSKFKVSSVGSSTLFKLKDKILDEYIYIHLRLLSYKQSEYSNVQTIFKIVIPGWETTWSGKEYEMPNTGISNFRALGLPEFKILKKADNIDKIKKGYKELKNRKVFKDMRMVEAYENLKKSDKLILSKDSISLK